MAEDEIKKQSIRVKLCNYIIAIVFLCFGVSTFRHGIPKTWLVLPDFYNNLFDSFPVDWESGITIAIGAGIYISLIVFITYMLVRGQKGRNMSMWRQLLDTWMLSMFFSAGQGVIILSVYVPLFLDSVDSMPILLRMCVSIPYFIGICCMPVLIAIAIPVVITCLLCDMYATLLDLLKSASNDDVPPED